MPTYEYACTSCGHRFETVQSFSEPSLTTCPACGGPLRKVFGNVGIVLKGSGFYKTDSRTNGSNGAPKAKEATEASPTSSSESSTKSDGAAKETSSAAASSPTEKAPAKTPASTGS